MSFNGAPSSGPDGSEQWLKARNKRLSTEDLEWGLQGNMALERPDAGALLSRKTMQEELAERARKGRK